MIIETFATSLAGLHVLGFDTEGCRRVVITETMPLPDYSRQEEADLCVAVALLRHGLARRDISLIGRAATISATISQAHLPKPRFDEILETAGAVGAVGVQVSHSGTIASLLFDRSRPDLRAILDRARTRLECCGVSETWEYAL